MTPCTPPRSGSPTSSASCPTSWSGARSQGEEYGSLAELYGNVVGQWGRYLGHVSRNVGGVYADTKYVGDEGVVYTPVPAERQRAAVQFLLNEGMTRPDWLLDRDILARIEPAGAANRVLSLQEGTLGRLFDMGRLARMEEQKWMDDDAYGPLDLMTDVRAGLWSELASGAEIDPSRRALQRAHVDALAEMLTAEPSNAERDPQGEQYRTLPASRSDVRALARGELLAVKAAASGALPRYRRDRVSELHLRDVIARVDEALDPERTAAGG